MSSLWDVGAAHLSGGDPFAFGLAKYFITRRAERKAQQFQRMQGEEAIHNAQRQKEEYMQDEEYRRQLLDQELAGRGLGYSSIANEDKRRFEASYMRGLASRQEELNKDWTGYQAMREAQSAKRRLGPINFLSSAFQAIAGGLFGG